MTSTYRRTAVVTGAASGIGRGLATQLAARGCALALSDVDGEGLDETVALCREVGADAESWTVDVGDREAMEAHVGEVVDRFGGVDLVFNNAGVALVAEATEQSLDDLQRVMRVNVDGVLNGSQLFLPHLIDSGDGHLVNISSLFGLLTIPAQSAYHASKFAVRGYTEALSVELAASDVPVRVSCVHPGGIDTAIVRNAVVASQRVPGDLAARFARLARTSPDEAAQVILKGVERDRRRILVGADAHVLHAAAHLLGARYLAVASWLGKRALRSLDGRAVADEATPEPSEARAS